LVDRIGEAENSRDGSGQGTVEAELPPEDPETKQQRQRECKGTTQVAYRHAGNGYGAPGKPQEKADGSRHDGNADACPEHAPSQLVGGPPAQTAEHQQGNLKEPGKQ